ncbi:MAG TPA: MFS transporter [Longimicrobium sp.]|nr:MFS transporter [Longimicrobium sp.]
MAGAAGRSPLGIVFVTVFLDLVGFGIVIPLLPLYGARFGAGTVAVTWLLALYSLMQFLFAPWWGRVSDRVGRRPVLLLGLFGSAASYLALGLAGSLPLLFAARAVNGFAGANVGVAQAYVADVTGPHDRAKGMGMIGAAFGLGFIFGPALGGLLLRWGPAAPFLGAGALAAANGVFALFRLPESLPPERRSAQPRGLGLGDRFRTLLGGGTPARLRVLFAAGFLVTAGIAAMEGTFSLWADRRWALTGPAIAFLFAWMGVVGVVAQGFAVGRLVKRLGERRAALLGLALLATGLAALALAPTLPLLAAAVALVALGHGISVPSVSSLISRQGGAGEQGRILGVSQSLSALGRVIGPVAGGVALAHVGTAAPFLSGAVLAAGALLLLAMRIGGAS